MLKVEDDSCIQFDGPVGKLDKLAVDRLKPWVDRLIEPLLEPAKHEPALPGIEIVHVPGVDERIAQSVYRADEIRIQKILVLLRQFVALDALRILFTDVEKRDVSVVLRSIQRKE